jgi:hypothetical protein
MSKESIGVPLTARQQAEQAQRRDFMLFIFL